MFNDYEINIRCFDDLSTKREPELLKDFSEEKIYDFEIKIRIGEDENIKEIFKTEFERVKSILD